MEETKCYCGHTIYCDCGPETLEETAENFWLNDDTMTDNDRISYVNGFVTCAKWQQERSYSEKEVIEILEQQLAYKEHFVHTTEVKEWFEQFKKK